MGGVDGLEAVGGILSVQDARRGCKEGEFHGGKGRAVLLSEKVLEVCDRVGGVSDEESLGLLSVVLVSINVGEDGGNLTVCHGDICQRFALVLPQCRVSHPQVKSSPPSSLAITSALSSLVYAMELLELPKVIPMTVRSPGAGRESPFVAILCVYVCVRPGRRMCLCVYSSWRGRRRRYKESIKSRGVVGIY